MAKKIFIVKRNGCFSPYDKTAESVILKWDEGEFYSLTYEKARNPKFHRYVFAAANTIIDNAPESSYWHNKTPYHFIKAVELSYGFVDEVIDCKGEIHLIPKSIDFANMNDEEFTKIYKAMITEGAKVLNITESELFDEMGAQYDN